jgi:hypothetical protein
MHKKYDLNNIRTEIYYKSSPKFEQVRSLCLEEDNWLSDNYTVENLIVEDHNGYAVAYTIDTNEPVMMAGVYNNGRYPSNVGRMVNRLYMFPKFRSTPVDMIDGFVMAHERIIYPLMQINSFDCYFITMQNRAKPSKGWWEVWKRSMQAASNNYWQEADGYVQSCPWPVKKCYQNFVYKDIVPGAFANWNPSVIDHDTWLTLEEGK